MSRKHSLLAAGLTALALTLVPASASARDYAIISRDIVPSGQYGSVPVPPQATQQARMYNALTPLFDHVTGHDLLTDFKPDSIGSAAVGPFQTEPVPHAGVTVRRDPYDVPQIIGRTRDDVTWGAGWVIAQDRGLLLTQARYDALVAAVDAPGLDALNLISHLESFQPSPQTVREVSKQTAVLRAAGPNGRGVLHDLEIYLQGINAYFKIHAPAQAPFTLTDVYAFNALKDQFVGEGGGDEAVRSEFLSALRRRLGTKRGTAVWHDLREAKDPEAPVSVPGHVRFQPAPRNTSGNLILDPGSLSASATRAVAVAPQYRAHASNALLVSARRSATHHPIMVAGPQIGYFYPGLTLEMDLEGPGISERGVTSAPFPGYIFIGRTGTPHGR